MDLLLPHTGLIIWTILSILSVIFLAVALFSVLRSTFKDSTVKLMWVLVIVFVPFIGPVLYLTIGRKQKLQIT